MGVCLWELRVDSVLSTTWALEAEGAGLKRDNDEADA